MLFFSNSLLLLLCPAGINKVFILSFCTSLAPALHSTHTSPPLLPLTPLIRSSSLHLFPLIYRSPPPAQPFMISFSVLSFFSLFHKALSLSLSHVCSFTSFTSILPLLPFYIHSSVLFPHIFLTSSTPLLPAFFLLFSQFHPSLLPRLHPFTFSLILPLHLS